MSSALLTSPLQIKNSTASTAGQKRSRSEPESELPCSKKTRGDGLLFAAKPVATIIVNDGGIQTPFYVHAHVLSTTSTKLRQKLQQDIAGDTSSTAVLLKGVSAETFDNFTRWLYFVGQNQGGFPYGVIDEDEDLALKECCKTKTTSVCVSCGLVRAANHGMMHQKHSTAHSSTMTHSQDGRIWYQGLGRQDRVYQRFIELYSFAARFGMEQLKQAILVTLRHRFDTWKQCPGPTIVNYALSKGLTIRTRMGQVLASVYAASSDGTAVSRSALATLPAAFLAEVLNIRNSQAQAKYKPKYGIQQHSKTTERTHYGQASTALSPRTPRRPPKSATNRNG